MWAGVCPSTSVQTKALVVRLRTDVQQDNLRLAHGPYGLGRASLVVDKPFRDPEQPEADNIFTLADKLMIFSQMSQLLNYAVAAMCRLDEQSRIAQDGSRGTSDSVAFLAAVNGFGLVILQVLSLAYVYKKERQEQAENKNDKREEDTRTRRFNNPLTDQEDDEDDAAEEEADEAGESGDEADEEGDQDDVATR